MDSRNRPIRFPGSRLVIGALGLLILLAAGCGEEKLPPDAPKDEGTITVTGGAV